MGTEFNMPQLSPISYLIPSRLSAICHPSPRDPLDDSLPSISWWGDEGMGTGLDSEMSIDPPSQISMKQVKRVQYTS